ncbi:hypothetical protein Tco_1279626, partial [Tanacetum coccineum]
MALEKNRLGCGVDGWGAGEKDGFTWRGREASEDRSQHKNRASALARLRSLLALK